MEKKKIPTVCSFPFVAFVLAALLPVGVDDDFSFLSQIHTYTATISLTNPISESPEHISIFPKIHVLAARKQLGMRCCEIIADLFKCSEIIHHTPSTSIPQVEKLLKILLTLLLLLKHFISDATMGSSNHLFGVLRSRC